MKKILILLLSLVLPLFSQLETLKYRQWEIEKWNYTVNNQKNDFVLFKAPCFSEKYNQNEKTELWIIYDKIKQQYEIYISIFLYKNKTSSNINDTYSIENDNIEYLKLKINNKYITLNQFDTGMSSFIVIKNSKNIVKDMLDADTVSYELKLKDTNSLFIRNFNVRYLQDLLNEYNIKL